MSNPLFQTDVSDQYRVRLLERARPTPEGVAYSDAGRDCLLPWSDVVYALAADVGEPEGVRAIVFDLCLELGEGDCVVGRLGVDPGADAIAVARLVQDGVGPERTSPSIKSVATDGIPTRWYADLSSFETDALEEIDPGARRSADAIG